MKRYTFTILAAVIAFSMMLYVLKFDKKPVADKGDLTGGGMVTVFSFDRSTALSVDINIGGEAIVFEKKGKKDWALTRPEPMRTNKPAVDSLLFVLSEYQADRVIEKNARDLRRFGLDRPRVVVTVKLKGGKNIKLLIGDRTPVEDASYVSVAGSRKVYQSPAMNVAPFLAGLDAFRDRSIADLDTETATRVEVSTAGGGAVVCERREGGKWFFAGKKKNCSDAANSLLNTVLYTEAAQFLPRGADAASIGFAPPRVSIKIKSPDEVLAIDIGSSFPEGLVYLRNVNRAEVYLSPEELLDSAKEFGASAGK